MGKINAGGPAEKSAILSKLYWGAGAGCALFLSFLLCRHVFFLLHSNRQWAFVMFLLGLAVIFIATLFNAKKVLVCTTVGYVFSFILGIVFNWEYDDIVIDGVVHSRNYTAWQIWTIAFIAIIFIGIIWEVASRRYLKKKSLSTQ